MAGKISKVLELNADPSNNYAIPPPIVGEVVPRTEGGKFLKGHSGNPAGRVKGLRNKITLERLLLEDVLRQTLVKQSPVLLNKAIGMAMGHECDQCFVPVVDENGNKAPPACGGFRPGNDRIMRALLDKVLATPKHDDAGEAKDNEIKILIQNMTASPTPMSEPGLTTVVVTPTQTKVKRDA